MKSSIILLALPAILAVSGIASAADNNDHHHHHHHHHERGDHKNNNEPKQKPNFLVFLTDDQDRRLHSLDYMPKVQKLIRDQGTELTNYFTTTAMCCPSRVSLWSGQFAHNHNVTDESAPHGAYPKFLKNKIDDDWLPLWLQNAGYNNKYIGKMINGVVAGSPPPKGFTHFEPLLGPNIYTFYTPLFSTNGGPPEAYTDTYQTDIISDKSVKILDDLAKNKTQPFLFVISPTAPHDEVWFDAKSGNVLFTPPVPAKRHEHLFKDLKVPKPPNFNPKIQDKASWINTLPRLNDSQVEDLDFLYRSRVQSLQATDELVERIIDRLDKNGQLENTYIIYTTDNGYHIGTHRMFAGKQTAYDEDTNIPFIISGPGIPKGKKSSAVSTHTHFAATVLHLAGLEAPDHLDAPPIPVLAKEKKEYVPQDLPTEAFAVEFWSQAFMENTTARFDTNVYKSVRLIGEDYNLLYTKWCTKKADGTSEKEYYDVKKDPFQLHNLYNQTKPELLNRLEALLNVLRTCKGPTCRDPWAVLHPEGVDHSSKHVGNDTEDDDENEQTQFKPHGSKTKPVNSLGDALNKKYDAYYASLPQFEFKSCLNHYEIENETTN